MNTPTPLHTPEDIIKKMEDNLKSEIESLEKEMLKMEGQISALQTTLANLRMWKELKKQD